MLLHAAPCCALPLDQPWRTDFFVVGFQELRLRAEGLGCGDQGLGSGVWGLRIRVSDWAEGSLGSAN